MNCPLFIDYTRECIKDVEVFPERLTPQMIKFCSGDKHKDCPFFKILKTKQKVCENVRSCPAFRNFVLGEFGKFAEMSNKYCTSKDYVKCNRYILKKKGKIVPLNLHPNGKLVKEWENK